MRSALRARGVSVALCLLLPALVHASAVDDTTDPGWPRAIDVEQGRILIYQPQLESLEDDRLVGRTAVSVTPAGSDQPVFGVIRFVTRISTDRDARTIEITDMDVTHVGFANATADQKSRFKTLLEAEVPKWDMPLSLDRVLTALAVGQQRRESAAGLSFEPPVILFTDYPTVLVTIDGEPRLTDIEDGDMKRVVNTPFLIVRDSKTDRYWLDGGATWYSADDVAGPWGAENKPPKRVAKVRSPEAEKAAKEARANITDERVPRVVVATEPTELIVIDGSPKYGAISIELLYVMNTESDVVVEIESQKHFVLLSGRWYAAKALEGPWTHVPSDELPASFVDIPKDSSRAHLRIFVAGTQEADEALIENHIPQTSAVKRGPADLEIEYDGEPRFEPVEGTEMRYAVNTSSSVLEIDGRYWVCDQAVWYEGSSPTGPWEVATARPEEIESIPASNPLYNVRYVYVYDSTPDVVYVGYTSGYLGSYPYGGCVVYGTGWYYPGWYGRYYYPHHSTWGFRVSYNPWYGWGVGISWSSGPFTFSLGWSGYSGYPHYGGYWGPGYVYAPNINIGEINIGRPGTGQPGDRLPGDRRPSTRPATERENLYNRPENRDRNVDRAPRDRKTPGAVSDRANNVFADSNGNLHRKGSQGWERHDGKSWKPEPGSGRGDRSGRDHSGLDRDYRARQRGNQRADSWNRQRSGGGLSSHGGSRGGGRGGASRGGGRRR